MKKRNKNHKVSGKRDFEIPSNTTFGTTGGVDTEQVYKNSHNFDIKGMNFDLCKVCLNGCDEAHTSGTVFSYDKIDNPLLISIGANNSKGNYDFVCNKELGIAYAYPTKFDTETENLVYIQDLETRRTFGIKPNFDETHEDLNGVTRKFKAFYVTKVFCMKTMPDLYVSYDVVYSNDDLNGSMILKKSVKLDNMYRKDSTGKFKEVQDSLYETIHSSVILPKFHKY